jgi:hypothetical protein
MNRATRLNKLAEAHHQWVKENLDAAEFTPSNRPQSGDYNLWYLDMDCDEATEARFQESVGLDG